MVTLLDVFYITAILKERLFACMIVFCSVDLFFNTIGIFYLFLAFGLFFKRVHTHTHTHNRASIVCQILFQGLVI